MHFFHQGQEYIFAKFIGTQQATVYPRADDATVYPPKGGVDLAVCFLTSHKLGGPQQ